jgi:hypothetical protein
MICKRNYAMLCKFKYVIYYPAGFSAGYQFLILSGYFIIYGDNFVDRRYIYGIMVLTLYPTGEKHERSKIGSTSRAKISKSSARESHQRAIPNKRLLRSPGPSPGQVRDASAGMGRSTADPSGGFPVRFLQAITLQGSGRFRAQWARGTGSDQTWSSPSSQAERVCGDIHPRAKERGWRSHFERTGQANPKAVRADCPSTQYSTGSEAREKKTALRKACPEELASPGAADPLCKLYEQLRSSVLEASDMPGRVYGLGVLLRQGMRAWLEATLEYAQVKQDSGHVVTPNTSWVLSSVEAELTIMLASIVVKHTEKEVR